MPKQQTPFAIAMANTVKTKPSGMKLIMQREADEALEKNKDNYFLLTEAIREREWKARRQKLGPLFPETIAERERRLNGGKPPVPPPPQEEKFIDLEPMRDMVEVVKKVVKHQVREKTQAVLGHLWKEKFVPRKERMALTVREEFKRREEAAYHQQQLDKIEESKQQQDMVKLAVHYLGHPKMEGHHAHAHNIIDYKNHNDADMELRRQRQKYHQMGHTHVPQKKAVAKYEAKKSWAEVMMDGKVNRDGYIPGRHSMYFGSHKIFALRSIKETFEPFKEFSTDAHDVCPEDRMHEIMAKIEWDEAVEDKTGAKMRALKGKKEQSLLVQKNSMYTRLKKNILDMSRRLIRYNKQPDGYTGEEELGGHSHLHSQSGHKPRYPNASMAESFVTSDTYDHDGSLKIVDSMLWSGVEGDGDGDGGSVFLSVKNKGTAMDQFLDPKITQNMKVAKARKKHLKDSSLKKEVLRHMSQKSAVTPVIMQPYYDDHKPDSPLKPSLSQPNRPYPENNSTAAGRHLVTSRPQGAAYSPWVESSYSKFHPAQKPQAPELTELLVQSLMSTPGIVNANPSPTHESGSEFRRTRRLLAAGLGATANSSATGNSKPYSLDHGSNVMSMSKVMGNTLVNTAVIDPNVYGEVTAKPIAEDCSYTDSRQNEEEEEEHELDQLCHESGQEGSQGQDLEMQVGDTLEPPAHMRYNTVHERPKTHETHIYHQDHNYFPQRSMALSLIRRKVETVGPNHTDLMEFAERQHTAKAMQSPPKIRYSDADDRKAYVSYHMKLRGHDNQFSHGVRPASAPYLPASSMTTADNASDGMVHERPTASCSHRPLPVHEDKYMRRDHHSNGVTMTPNEFKHYTIANTVRELYYRKKGVKIAPIQPPPEECESTVAQTMNQDSLAQNNENDTLIATRSQYLLENSRDIQGKVKVPLVRMRNYHGLGNFRIRSSTEPSANSKYHKTKEQKEKELKERADRFDFSGDVPTGPSKYKFHFVSLKKLNFMKKQKEK